MRFRESSTHSDRMSSLAWTDFTVVHCVLEEDVEVPGPPVEANALHVSVEEIYEVIEGGFKHLGFDLRINDEGDLDVSADITPEEMIHLGQQLISVGVQNLHVTPGHVEVVR